MFSTEFSTLSIDYRLSSNKNSSIDYRDNIKQFDEVYDSMSDKNKHRSDNANAMANFLVKTYNAPTSKPFFLKCAWHLSEAEIIRLVELSKNPKVRNPLYYFIGVAKNKL